MTDALTAALDATLGAAPPVPTPTPPRPRPVAVPVALPAEGTLVEVLVAEVWPDPDNARERLGDVSELQASIAEQGLIQPLIVRRDAAADRLVIVAGHRRYEAVKRLGWSRVEVIVRRDMAPDEVLAKMLVENGQRSGLDPIEEARALMRLKTLDSLTDADVARRVGMSQVKVSGRLRLLALDPADQEAVRAGTFGVVAAVRSARIQSGHVRKTGVSKAWHFGPDHELSANARARCRRMNHKAGRMVGGMACGECWESVIRADERTDLHRRSATSGKCVTCGTPAADAPTLGGRP